MSAAEEEAELPAELWAPRRARWDRAWARWRTNVSLAAGTALLLAFAALALVALVRYGASLTDVGVLPEYYGAITNPGPSWAHPFGVLGGLDVDIASTLLRATPIDLLLVGGIVLAAANIGLFVGSLAGLGNRVGEFFAVSLGDLWVSVPPFLFVLVIFLGVQPYVPLADQLPVFGVVFVLVLWPYYARPVEARASAIGQSAFVEASRAGGAGAFHVLRRHVVPNAIGPVLAQLPVDVANVFFVLTVFPYLGCVGSGTYQNLTPLPGALYPEWGNLFAYGVCYGLQGASWTGWWMVVFPLVPLVAFGVAVALFAEGLSRFLGQAPQA